MIALEDVKKNEELNQLILSSQKQLNALGYTEHSIRHMSIVSQRAGELLTTLDYPAERIELAKIAGYMHDIGNAINRNQVRSIRYFFFCNNPYIAIIPVAGCM